MWSRLVVGGGLVAMLTVAARAEAPPAAAERQDVTPVASALQEPSVDSVATHFNTIYTQTKDEVFDNEPNAFLVSVAEGLPAGRALDVAMGQGRNALYLATRGWQVTGFDIAEEGLAIARREAARQGLTITAVRSRYEDFDFGEKQWDLIVFSYAWVPLTDPDLVRRVDSSLRPGGLVLIEHPVEDPLHPQQPVDSVNALLRAFDGFRILRYEDVDTVSDWRRSHIERTKERSRIVRLLARRR